MTKICSHKRADFAEVRKEIIERDHERCQVCGNNMSLTVHHIYSRKTCPIHEFDMDNLITLCYKCHKSYHNKYKQVNPYTFSKWILSRRHNVKRVLVEWVDGRDQELVFLDEPPSEKQGLLNDDINSTIIHEIHVMDVDVISEQDFIDLMCDSYDVDRVGVHRALTVLSKRGRVDMFYDVDMGTVIQKKNP